MGNFLALPYICALRSSPVPVSGFLNALGRPGPCQCFSEVELSFVLPTLTPPGPGWEPHYVIWFETRNQFQLTTWRRSPTRSRPEVSSRNYCVKGVCFPRHRPAAFLRRTRRTFRFLLPSPPLRSCCTRKWFCDARLFRLERQVRRGGSHGIFVRSAHGSAGFGRIYCVGVRPLFSHSCRGLRSFFHFPAPQRCWSRAPPLRKAPAYPGGEAGKSRHLLTLC